MTTGHAPQVDHEALDREAVAQTPAAATGSAPAEEIGWSFLKSRRWIGYFALVVVFSIVCSLLGQWQFMRRGEARAEIARIDLNYEAAPLPLSEVLPETDDYADNLHKWQRVTASGEYLDEVYLVRNRPNAQSVGFNVLAPFLTDSGEVFIVDRGWIPRGADADAPEAVPASPEGRVDIVARLKGGEPIIDGRSTSGNTVATIHLPELERLTGLETYTGAYGLIISEDPESETGALPGKPERDEGPHLSYALQWYVFIIMAFVGLGYAIRQEYRSENPDSDFTVRGKQKERDRKKRRGLSDAEQEDAFLDGDL